LNSNNLLFSSFIFAFFIDFRIFFIAKLQSSNLFLLFMMHSSLLQAKHELFTTIRYFVVLQLFICRVSSCSLNINLDLSAIFLSQVVTFIFAD
jgi:hypothetical protein